MLPKSIKSWRRGGSNGPFWHYIVYGRVFEKIPAVHHTAMFTTNLSTKGATNNGMSITDFSVGYSNTTHFHILFFLNFTKIAQDNKSVLSPGMRVVFD